MRAVNTVDLCKDYFDGFKAVAKHESVGAVLLGLLKILTYALILPPLLLGGVYLRSKKIVEFQQSIDSKLDSVKVNITFANVFPSENDSKKLITYLVNKLDNFEGNDNAQLEKERFAKGFKLLSYEAQADFFKEAIANKCLALAVKWIPRDITYLNFVSGAPNAIHHAWANKRNIELLLPELPTFTSLDRIELNLRGLGFYSAAADKNVQNMTNVQGLNFHYSADTQRTFEHMGVTYHHYNDTLPILKTIVALKELINRRPTMEWSIRLMNLSVAQKTGDSRSIGGDIPHATHLINYLYK